MSYVLLGAPDSVAVQTDDRWLRLQQGGGGHWVSGDIIVAAGGDLCVALSSPSVPIRRVKLRWQREVQSPLLFLNDHWERGYGDLEWRGLVPERPLPWYFLTHDGARTHGYGVKTGPNAICFWQVDHAGVTLWLDVRNGGVGVQLGDRSLPLATVVTREGAEGESPFQAAQNFCRLLCDRPLLPAQPVYGSNNWYYAYSNSSHQQILRDAELVASLSPAGENRPFMVIDAGWQLCQTDEFWGGPWYGNAQFPDMPRLAEEMRGLGARPGIWVRPLLTAEKVPASWRLPDGRMGSKTAEQFLDPSLPAVLEYVARDIRRMTAWGYEVIKHDFSTYDIWGRWGFNCSERLTNDDWSFADPSKTTAEIILDFYRTIREAAGSALVIGCNTVGHLGAGLFELQRTGDDTSGKHWERTRRYGVNTLAFRMPQHGALFAVDADCVGLTNQVPWEMNRQWLDLLARSGTPLFVSADPEAVGSQQRAALREAFATASRPLPPGEPLDWLHTTCPRRWRLDGQEVAYDWYGEDGVRFFAPRI